MGDQERDGRSSDLDVVRLQLSQKMAGDGNKPTLNPLARQVANQLRDTSHSPNMVIGQLRLFPGQCHIAGRIPKGAVEVENNTVELSFK